MPTLLDPHFFRSVTYLCEHDDEGAFGIVINQPLSLSLGEIFEQMEIKTEHPMISQRLVFAGGPVHKERGFILHNAHGNPKKKWQKTYSISPEISLTTSTDILEDMAINKGPEQCLFALGYAHWEAGQLEKEMAENAWLYAPASSEIIFQIPIEKRWRAAAAKMGVDVDRLSDDIGHA